MPNKIQECQTELNFPKFSFETLCTDLTILRNKSLNYWQTLSEFCLKSRQTEMLKGLKYDGWACQLRGAKITSVRYANL